MRSLLQRSKKRWKRRMTEGTLDTVHDPSNFITGLGVPMLGRGQLSQEEYSFGDVVYCSLSSVIKCHWVSSIIIIVPNAILYACLPHCFAPRLHLATSHSSLPHKSSNNSNILFCNPTSSSSVIVPFLLSVPFPLTSPFIVQKNGTSSFASSFVVAAAIS